MAIPGHFRGMIFFQSFILIITTVFAVQSISEAANSGLEQSAVAISAKAPVSKVPLSASIPIAKAPTANVPVSVKAPASSKPPTKATSAKTSGAKASASSSTLSANATATLKWAQTAAQNMVKEVNDLLKKYLDTGKPFDAERLKNLMKGIEDVVTRVAVTLGKDASPYVNTLTQQVTDIILQPFTQVLQKAVGSASAKAGDVKLDNSTRALLQSSVNSLQGIINTAKNYSLPTSELENVQKAFFFFWWPHYRVVVPTTYYQPYYYSGSYCCTYQKRDADSADETTQAVHEYTSGAERIRVELQDTNTVDINAAADDLSQLVGSAVAHISSLVANGAGQDEVEKFVDPVCESITETLAELSTVAMSKSSGRMNGSLLQLSKTVGRLTGTARAQVNSEAVGNLVVAGIRLNTISYGLKPFT